MTQNLHLPRRLRAAEPLASRVRAGPGDNQLFLAQKGQLSVGS
jgi:hypothetical protein